MTLYELTDEFRALTETWDDTITDDEFMKKMDDLNTEFDSKIKNCAFYVKNLSGDILAIDAEIKRLQARNKSATNKVENMKRYMKDNMLELQRLSLDFDVISVKIQNNPPKVVISNEDLIPAEYIRTREVVTIDKTAIKKDGGCSGAEIIQEQGLRIR